MHSNAASGSAEAEQGCTSFQAPSPDKTSAAEDVTEQPSAGKSLSSTFTVLSKVATCAVQLKLMLPLSIQVAGLGHKAVMLECVAGLAEAGSDRRMDQPDDGHQEKKWWHGYFTPAGRLGSAAPAKFPSSTLAPQVLPNAN